MNLYPIALFVHLVGVVGVFAGMGTWLFGIVALRRAHSVEQMRAIAEAVIAAGKLVVGSLVPLGVAGFWMALTTWGLRATWLIVATVTFVLLAPFGALVIDPRIRAIARTAQTSEDGPLSPALAAHARDPVLGAGVALYLAVLLGIVYLMTTKPPLVPALLAVGVTLGVGLVAGAPVWWAARSQPGAAVPRTNRL